MLTGSLGNSYAIENLIRANSLGLRKKKNILMFVKKNEKFRNNCLTKYFSKYINIIREDDTNLEIKNFSSLLALPLGLCLPTDNECLFLDAAANRCESKEEESKKKNYIFSLDEKDLENGKKSLKKFGLPDDAWYVTLHIRQVGYRNETKENTKENFRNSNPDNYIKAIKRITDAGGWVFRMGDSSMTPLPKMNQLIDYANSSLKSDSLDIFLGATSKFCIGTDAGYLRIPRFFGVPVILTNCSTSIIYYSLKKNDLYLPRLIKKKINNESINLNQMMTSPLALYVSDDNFKKSGLYTIENSPEEIDSAVIQMMQSIENKQTNNSEYKKQNLAFKEVVEKKGTLHPSSLTAFAACSSEFLTKNKNLF